MSLILNVLNYHAIHQGPIDLQSCFLSYHVINRLDVTAFAQQNQLLEIGLTPHRLDRPQNSDLADFVANLGKSICYPNLQTPQGRMVTLGSDYNRKRLSKIARKS